MIFLGDFFAIGLVIVLSLFFFDDKYYLTKSSRYFVGCLVLTALTAATDLASGSLLYMEAVPVWLNMTVNSLYFLINIITTSCIALYLFTKILEHSHNNHCMHYAQTALLILFVVYVGVVLGNIQFGWLFYFDENGTYCRGPLNALGYYVTVCQMVLVTICYFRNRKNASKSMRRALIQTFPVTVICIAIQRAFPQIMLNGYIMAMVDTILFLTFQGQRLGVHTLTKLNDRHRFFKEVDVRMKNGKQFQVFLINIKNFSKINQKYGHILGDEVLYQFAFSLETLIKNSMAFHMNGTVFALVLPYLSQKAAYDNCGLLLQFLDDGISCLEESIHFDYTVAEYIVEDGEGNAEVFYERLEYAANMAYQQNCHYMRYVPAIGRQMERERYLMERIQSVDRKNGFRVWYQPICCLKSGNFCSMEALVRLEEPDGSIVNPGEFISLAEKTGVITSITWFVVEEVCAYLASHSELENITVSINLPMSQLLENGFASRLIGTVDQYGVRHEHICLEFTEREILDTFEQTKSVMDDLSAAGFRFYLDDFGTGYSNFNNMLQLPFRFIKLDSSLIRNSCDAGNQERFIRAITKLSHEMGMQVIAEGVESLGSVEDLGRQGVDRIQGFAFARPMPPADLLKFYRDNPVV